MEESATMPGAPGTATALTPGDLGLLPPAPDCPEQQPGEYQIAYAHRVLGYAFNYGIEPLTLSQLEIADHHAQIAVCDLPATLAPHHAILDARLHALRLQLAGRMAEKRRQLAAINRALGELTGTPGDAPDAPQSQPGAQESDADRAARLLRAALLLIMGQPPTGNGGGRPAPLVPPAPTRPPAGSYANSRPTLTDHRRPDDIAF